MANDNTLGAPTEGLGQTVTFGFKVADKNTSQPMQRGRVRAGVAGQAGGNVTMARGVKIETDPTVDMLMKVGSGLIDKEIKEARTTAYVSGMQRAMTGEAVEDIAAQQPAWSRVFGDSDAVEGARAYSTEAKVQEVLLSIENDMPNLRKMDAKGANQFFVKSVNSALTGHSATDSAIMGAVQRSLPAVMKRHAQQHYAYMQEEAANQEATALDVAAQRLQNAAAQAADGKITGEDYAEQEASVSMLAVPAMGRDPDWVRKQRTSSFVLMAERGQFHALNAMEKLGITELLLPEQKAAVERSRQANELQYRSKFGELYTERISALTSLAERPTPGWTADNLMASMREMNDDYRMRTGSKTDFFNTSVIAAYGEKTTQAIAAVMKAQVDENEKAIAAARKVGDAMLLAQATDSAISQAATNGTLTSLVANSSVTNEQVSKWFHPRAMALINSSMTAKVEDFKFLTHNADFGYVNQAVTDQIQGMVAGAVVAGEASPSFIATYELWRKMNASSPKAAAAYFKEDHAKFQKFNLGHPGSIDVRNASPHLQAAFMGSFGPNAATGRSRLSRKEVDDLVKKTTSSVESGIKYWRPEWLGGPNKLRPGVAEFIGRSIHDTMEVFAVTGSQEDALQAALQVVPQRGLQIFGGFAWQDKENSNIYQELQTLVGKDKFGLAAPEETAEDFGAVVDAEIEKHGGMTSVHMIRQGSMLLGTGYKDGAQRVFKLEVAGIAEQVMKRQQARRKAAAPTTYSDGKKSAWYRFGSEITYQEKRDAEGNPLVPSIYNRK